MLWWLNHYAFPDMAGLVIGYLNVWIIPVIKNRRVASWFAPDGTGGKLLFIGKTQFYPGKSTTCLTNSATDGRSRQGSLRPRLRAAKLAHLEC